VSSVSTGALSAKKSIAAKKHSIPALGQPSWIITPATFLNAAIGGQTTLQGGQDEIPIE
jgi:hypothetical protein